VSAWPRATLLAVGLLLAGCAPPGGGLGTPGPGAGRWQELPPPPLSARQQAVTAWTGAEALFIGGDLGPPCPESTACDRAVVPARDGAGFDPATGTWRRIADAPVPIGPWSTPAVLGDAVFLVAQDRQGAGAGPRLLSYDASDDAWTAHRLPPDGLDSVSLVAVGDRVLIVRSERRAGDPPDQLYDPATRTWTPVPEDPLGPSSDRIYVSTPQLLVLLAKELAPNPGIEPNVVRAALLEPDTLQWVRRIEDSEQVGGHRWTWTGRRLVDATLGEVDGGAATNDGRSYPPGGVLDLDAGEWGALPDAPLASVGVDPAEGAWPVEAVGGPLTALEGWIYDDRAESWTQLAPPVGGPTRPGSVVWAGERLVVLGGVDYAREPSGELSTHAWLYSPASVEDRPVEQEIVGAWELVDGTSGGRPISRPDGWRATLSADGQRLTGTAFCNGYGGRYRLDGDRLHVADVAQTEMACLGPGVMEAEAAFLTVLTAGDLRLSWAGDELVLENDRGLLRFRPQTPVPTADLVGTRWVLDSLVDGETASSTVGEPAVLQLADDGTFTASTGCRPISGRWRAAGDTVTLHYEWPDASCPPEVESQEQHIVGAIGNGFRVAIDGDRLTVTGPRGQGLVYRAS
jgi:heat shock protein HslJ